MLHVELDHLELKQLIRLEWCMFFLANTCRSRDKIHPIVNSDRSSPNIPQYTLTATVSTALGFKDLHLNSSTFLEPVFPAEAQELSP